MMMEEEEEEEEEFRGSSVAFASSPSDTDDDEEEEGASLARPTLRYERVNGIMSTSCDTEVWERWGNGHLPLCHVTLKVWEGVGNRLFLTLS